jgi:glycine hydroxymethyltransferase
MANALALFALTKPGDLIMVQSLRAGGNWSYHAGAIPSLRSLVVEEIPPTDDYGIDLPRLRKVLTKRTPRFFVVGGSMFLFPFPLQELREIADLVGARILYDAAHVGPLIAGRCFQQPLLEGADVLTTGTHKMMGGPVGGLVLCNDFEVAKPMLHLTFPAFLQTRDQNKFAAAAWALAEMQEFSEDYARQIIGNAKALAKALESEGFRPLFRERDYTNTHQVILDAREIGAERLETRCQESNILVHKVRLPGENRDSPRGGVRIGVQELTRQGMKEADMGRVATFMQRAVFGSQSSKQLRSEIEVFVAEFQDVHFSFDSDQRKPVPQGAARI